MFNRLCRYFLASFLALSPVIYLNVSYSEPLETFVCIKKWMPRSKSFPEKGWPINATLASGQELNVLTRSKNYAADVMYLYINLGRGDVVLFELPPGYEEGFPETEFIDAINRHWLIDGNVDKCLPD